ncbi:MAG: hypothetical protein OXC30_05775 [Alphaproteobacteria bacterium]|nr:hypothetical protein [Alphaproteobacteria bacterium]
MLFLLIFLLSLVGCGPQMHDTVESLPRGAYILDKESFMKTPKPVTPYVVHFLRSKGFLINPLNIKGRMLRYTLFADYKVITEGNQNVAVLRLLADCPRNKRGNALITIKRTIDPNEPLDRHIRLMVTALDNKFPIVNGSGQATCSFEYGLESSFSAKGRLRSNRSNSMRR